MALMDRFYTRERRNARLMGVVDNLNFILNTKKSFGAWVKELGIGDFNQYKARDKIVATIIKEIEENIRLFEPRVRVDLIRQVEADNPFRIRLEVKCVFLDFERPIYIVIDSLYNQVFLENLT